VQDLWKGASTVSAAEKLNELWLEHKRLSHEGVISHNPERVMVVLPLIVEVVQTLEEMKDVPMSDAKAAQLDSALAALDQELT
jgi:ABC-type hemin transport system substrate-binding protein